MKMTFVRVRMAGRLRAGGIGDRNDPFVPGETGF